MLSTYVSGRRLATIRRILRSRGLDPASARPGVPGPGCYVSTILDRADMRRERAAVEAELRLVGLLE